MAIAPRGPDAAPRAVSDELVGHGSNEDHGAPHGKTERARESFIPQNTPIIEPTLIVDRANVDEFTQRINILRVR